MQQAHLQPNEIERIAYITGDIQFAKYGAIASDQEAAEDLSDEVVDALQQVKKYIPEDDLFEDLFDELARLTTVPATKAEMISQAAYITNCLEELRATLTVASKRMHKHLGHAIGNVDQIVNLTSSHRRNLWTS